MTAPPSLLEFPSEFSIKVMGRSDSNFKDSARTIIEKHAGPLEDVQIRERPSSGSRFIGYTFTFRANSREQLDKIYRELSACPAVLMTL